MGDFANETIEKARQLGAPFGMEALKQIRGDQFGSPRATRSTDIVIFNNTNKEFRLIENSCETGGWSGGLLPPERINPNSSVVLGAQSHGFMTGATGCRAKYITSGGNKYFWISTSNPYIGSVHAEEECSYSLLINKVVGNGSNNIVHFSIYTKN